MKQEGSIECSTAPSIPSSPGVGSMQCQELLVSLLLFQWLPIACVPKRSCSSPRCPEGLWVSKEGVRNSREDAQKLQTRRTIRVVVLKDWSTGLCFRIFPWAVEVQIPGSSQGAEDTALRLQGWLARLVPRADMGSGPSYWGETKETPSHRNLLLEILHFQIMR